MVCRCLVGLIGFFFGGLEYVLAQSAGTTVLPDSSIEKPMRSLQFSYSYMNPVSYRGRTFGVHQFGMMPQITYQTQTNWRIYSVGYIWNNFQTSELGKIDLGIEKEGRLGKYFSYTLGYERWLFPNADSDESQPLNNFTEAYLARSFNDWTPAVGIYYMFGSSQLVQTDLEISRYVGITDGSRGELFIEPLLKGILANQNYLINGIYQSRFDRRGQPIPGPSGSRSYGLVDIEVNLPITLQTTRWSLVVDPRVAKPFNTLPGERTKPFFYAVATMTYTLRLPKSHGY